MLKRKLKISVLGTVNIALRSVIPAILNLEDKFELVGVSTRKIDNKKDYRDLKIIEGYESIINPDFIDAVYIPLPNSLHFRWVKKSFRKKNSCAC